VFDEVLDAESALCAPLFSDEPGMPALLVERLSRITSALVFALDASPLMRWLESFGVRAILRQDPFPSTPVPIVDYHLSLFPALAFADEARVPRVDIGPVQPGEMRNVAIHPGSGSPRKNWALSGFIEVARRLESDGESVTWITGPAEEELPLPSGARTWQAQDLPALAGSLARCRLYVGNDSGVTHLAAACGCPTLALFGATDSRVWLPRGRMVRAVHSPNARMDGISAERVLSACRKLLGK
jgi:ADP-heptose:LPS heptosyltransferase